MSENRLPDYLDHILQAATDACAFKAGSAMTSRCAVLGLPESLMSAARRSSPGRSRTQAATPNWSTPFTTPRPRATATASVRRARLSGR